MIVSMRNVLTVVFKDRVLVHEREVRLKNLARSLIVCQSSPWQPFSSSVIRLRAEDDCHQATRGSVPYETLMKLENSVSELQR